MPRTLTITVFAVLALLNSTGSSSGQEPPQFPEPEKEHQFLKRFVGEWDSTTECMGAPGMEPSKGKGVMKSRMLGEFWVISELDATMMGDKFQAALTLGYDPQKKKYVGTWTDSMTSQLWLYEGVVEGSTLTLTAEGPNFLSPGTTTKFQDIYEFKSADEMRVASKILGEDGKWITMMTGQARRKSAGK